jgi:4-hydroxy-tetrahydrodipicolinate synthase
VTPFREDGSLDEPGLRRLVDRQVAEGVDFIVPCGSTGEAATLTEAEHVRVVAITAEQVDGRVPVVAGAGSNDTAEAVHLARAVAAVGATHTLQQAPMYNRPPQRGLLAHFRAVADASDVPVVLYNVPSRTGCNIEADTTLALAEHPGIVAIKEASGSLAQIAAILRARPAGFGVLSGDDPFTLPLMALGGDGVISVIANAAPAAMADLVRAAACGDIASARARHFTLLPLMTAAFVESNPIPIKAALAELGLAGATVRSPLVTLDERYLPALRSALREAGLLDR